MIIGFEAIDGSFFLLFTKLSYSLPMISAIRQSYYHELLFPPAVQTKPFMAVGSVSSLTRNGTAANNKNPLRRDYT
ncbi:hypothetical protein GZ77_23275 [Endozoicomonas montiporae]|uniref:Uncharacterized protein n=1 Tax=Endozoicomonas montiporae TaxID=1027273 RepID=A0A081N0P0_9GAMM|nr:hypothetical protein GZ77_23275 [Endozoicomonas montiporae]